MKFSFWPSPTRDLPPSVCTRKSSTLCTVIVSNLRKQQQRNQITILKPPSTMTDAITPPPPPPPPPPQPLDNNTPTHEPPTTTAQLTKKQRTALAKAEQKELNLNRISAANKRILAYDNTLIMTTTTDVKPFKDVTDINNNLFRIGDYVDVREDFSAGYNMPAGCGYVLEADQNFVCVRYTPAHDSGRRHNKIPTSKVISAILNQDMMVKEEKRNREQKEIQNDEVKIVIDRRTVTEKLLELLTMNNCRKQ